MRGARGFRDEFSTFHASAYPQLAAQTLAITGDAGTTRAAAAATLARVWRSWPSLRGTADVLVRARWTAVLVAAERESTTPVRSQQAGDAVQEITGAAVAADVVVVAALQRLPRVQRRALVLHYMGGVSVRHLSELSGSSAEHVELLLDDGFTALAGSLDWSVADDEHDDLDGPDMSFDWVAEALADTAARLPAQISAPPPTVLLRNAAVVRWSVRAIPVAGAAACAAVMAAVAQPDPAEVHVPAVYAQHGSGAEGSAPAYAARSDLAPETAPEPAADGGSRPQPTVRLRSIALTSLLDTPAPTSRPPSTSPAPAPSPRASAPGSARRAASGSMDAGSGSAAGKDAPGAVPAAGGTPGAVPAAGGTPGAVPAAGGTPGAVPAAGSTPGAVPAAGGTPGAVPAAGGTPGAVPAAGGGLPGAAAVRPDAGGSPGLGGVPQAVEVAPDAASGGVVADASAQLRLAAAAPVPAPAAVVPDAAVPADEDPLVLGAVSDPLSTDRSPSEPPTAGPLTAPSIRPATDPPTSPEKSAAHDDTATDPAARLAATAGDPTARPAAEKPSAQQATADGKAAERDTAAADKPAARQATGAGKPTTRHTGAADSSAARDTAEKPRARQATSVTKPSATRRGHVEDTATAGKGTATADDHRPGGDADD